MHPGRCFPPTDPEGSRRKRRFFPRIPAGSGWFPAGTGRKYTRNMEAVFPRENSVPGTVRFLEYPVTGNMQELGRFPPENHGNMTGSRRKDKDNTLTHDYNRISTGWASLKARPQRLYLHFQWLCIFKTSIARIQLRFQTIINLPIRCSKNLILILHDHTSSNQLLEGSKSDFTRFNIFQSTIDRIWFRLYMIIHLRIHNSKDPNRILQD